MNFKPLLFLISLLLSPWVVQSSESRIPWTYLESYDGPSQSSFNRLRYDIPIIMRQTAIDLAGRLGLDYRDGWRYPLEVGFTDQTPRGVENALAYVEFLGSTDGKFMQKLWINLKAYDREEFNFQQVFAHELTHAMLNDALGAQAALQIPIWLHEGLAVYGADQGEKMVKSYVYQFSGFAEAKLLNGLDGPHGALDYAEDYWAIKYLNDRYSSNALHNFVREVIYREGRVSDALEYTINETMEQFQNNVRTFAKKEIEKIGPRRKGKYEKPY